MSGQVPPLRRRLLKAAGVLVVNIILWIVVPYYIGALIAKQVPSTPLSTPIFVYEFGAIMTAVQVIIALTEGMAVSVPFISASYLIAAYYVWAATNGGNLSFVEQGLTVSIGFQLLVFVLILPSIWGAIRAPVNFLLWRRAWESSPAATGSSP